MDDIQNSADFQTEMDFINYKDSRARLGFLDKRFGRILALQCRQTNIESSRSKSVVSPEPVHLYTKATDVRRTPDKKRASTRQTRG